VGQWQGVGICEEDALLCFNNRLWFDHRVVIPL